jgi:hypothetical protein
MTSLTDFIPLYADSPCPVVYKGQAKRFVETQEVAATMKLVDDLDEQYLLEQMLDDVKPHYRPNTEHMHYLLKTPFRYPPLKYGSRFGTRLIPSFFYASENEHTVLAEVAYYRFIFLQHMQERYEKPIHSQHMMFSLRVNTRQCADLTLDKFNSLKSALVNVDNYQFCQNVGQYLQQEQGISVIRFHSARAKDGVNIAIAAPKAITSKKPESCQNWLCLTHLDKVSFTQASQGQPTTFHISDFMHNGILPEPA